MDIVFAGTPAFALPSLRALSSTPTHRLRGVYTQPDRPAGRGRHPKPSAVKQLAMELGVIVYQPARLTDDATAELRTIAPDVLVVAAYGLILPTAVLELPRYGCINLHASLLPRWRGAAPIPRAIEAGDCVTGVTIMQIDKGMDTGAILSQREEPITDDDTAKSLRDRLAVVGATLLCETLDRIEHREITPTPQDGAAACYAHKLRKEEATLDWTASASELQRKVRAFDPWPVAQTRFHGRLLRIWQASVADPPMDQQQAEAGTVLAAGASGIQVTTGDGVLILRRLQLEGGKPMTIDAFLHGHPVRPGDAFG
ncbi:MAG: methionyl-tRNA formyltransferase [Acidiferrobacterales bacterium]